MLMKTTFLSIIQGALEYLVHSRGIMCIWFIDIHFKFCDLVCGVGNLHHRIRNIHPWHAPYNYLPSRRDNSMVSLFYIYVLFIVRKNECCRQFAWLTQCVRDTGCDTKCCRSPNPTRSDKYRQDGLEHHFYFCGLETLACL